MAAPSANKFGQVSPTLAEHVRAEFPDEVAAGMPVLEGGASEVGIESTILDLSRLDQGAGPVLLRPGHVSAAQIEAVLGARCSRPRGRAAPRSTLKAHYAPRTELELAGDARVADVLQGIGLPSGQVALVSFDPRRPRPMPACNGARCRPIARYAQALYALLRELDARAMPASSCRRRPPTTHGMRSTTASAAAAAAFTLDTSDL